MTSIYKIKLGRDNQRREHMAGVNMVLAESHQNTLKQQITTICIITVFEFDVVVL